MQKHYYLLKFSPYVKYEFISYFQSLGMRQLLSGIIP
jgi:hypothetical protein